MLRNLAFPYLAISYCLTVSIVSSMVLLHRVFTDETKKFSALIKVSPFLVKLFWVSELYKNSSWSSGDLWARSLKHSPKALWVIKEKSYFTIGILYSTLKFQLNSKFKIRWTSYRKFRYDWIFLHIAYFVLDHWFRCGTYNWTFTKVQFSILNKIVRAINCISQYQYS